MNILAIDTLTPTLTIAALGSKGLVTQSFAGNGPSHAERLLPLIDAAVSAAGFTAAAKALQLSSNSCFIPVPTLPCIASQYEAWNGSIAAVIDAKRDRFYIQLFKNGTAVTEAFDKTANDMLPYFSENEEWLVTGYGTAAFKDAAAISQSTIRFHFIEADTLSFAYSMIQYMQKHGNVLKNAVDYAGPQYIRKSDAEKD